VAAEEGRVASTSVLPLAVSKPTCDLGELLRKSKQSPSGPCGSWGFHFIMRVSFIPCHLA